MTPGSARWDTRALEVLLLTFAIFLSACWWFGDGRYRDRHTDAPEYRRAQLEQRDLGHAPAGQ